jgi:hypothetical protein
MTKKDFILFAEALAAASNICQSPDETHFVFLVYREVVEVLKTSNPLFDEKRFRDLFLALCVQFPDFT